MDFSEEWKSVFPIGGVFGAPLLLSSNATKAVLGPLRFNPNPHSTTLLFHSPALSPPILNPPAHLTLPRFVASSTSAHHDSFVPLSVSSSVRPGLDDNDGAASWLARNRIQLLKSSQGSFVIVFFPTGPNFDRIGFLTVEVKEGRLNASGSATGGVCIANKQLGQRIRGVLVSPVADSDWNGGGSDSDSVIGYCLALCIYSVNWFCVRVGVGGSEKPEVVYMGSRAFKSSAVVSACWSPHLPEESVVLLENGSLFLFDMESSGGSSFRGTRLRVSWDDDESINSGNGKWLGCEFSWHPRVLIVARSDAAFMVDWRSDQPKVTCLARVDMFGPYAPSGMTRFRAFSKAVSSHFHFVLVSGRLLVLCDVRRPFSPVLQWAHCLDKPCYVDTFRMSSLRSNPRDGGGTHKWATESGFGILLGSFVNSEFSLFTYGPPLPAPYKSIASKISEVSKPFYAWELPSSVNVMNAGCVCGSCLVKEEFSKDALPEWVDWKQKRDIVIGFGILGKELGSSLLEPDEFGGFSLIRLMSSGKLEVQRYSASWDLIRTSNHHTDPLPSNVSNLYSSLADEKYKFPRKFKYLELDYLSAYLNGDLTKILDSKMTNASEVGLSNEGSFSLECHEALCEKLKNSGLNRFRTSPIVSLVLNDMNVPTTIREVALRKTWAGLPMELLQLAFSSYSELLDVQLDQKKVSLEFLPVPDLPQLPPFILRQPSHRSNKWSRKKQRKDDTLVGPALPLPVLMTIHELSNGGCPMSSQAEPAEFSADAELNIQCDEVMQMAKEVAATDSTTIFDDEHAVSLASDDDDIRVDSQQPKSFILHRPAAAAPQGTSTDHSFSTLITKLQSKEAGADADRQDPDRRIFDDLCPIDLKFEKNLGNFGKKEAYAYKVLQRDLLNWQKQFKPYQDFFCN